MMIEPPPVDSAVLASMAGDASFQHLFMANPQPMFIFEMVSLRFLAVNQAAMCHYGYSQHEFLAMTIKDIRPPEDIPALLTTLERVQAGLDDVPGIWRHLTKDGRILEVEISTHVIQLAGQKAKLALINDVTDRQKAERALREHEAQLRLFIERIERLEEDKKGIADDIKDVYAEAKGTGFDAKTMRKIVALRKMDKGARQEAEALLETYKAALGLAD